jgi:hypothetical protein
MVSNIFALLLFFFVPASICLCLAIPIPPIIFRPSRANNLRKVQLRQNCSCQQ